MANPNEREKIINRFIIRIFRGKARGISKPLVMIKLKKFIRDNGKKWTSKLEGLFDSTWNKNIPPEILAEFKQEKPLRIKPNLEPKIKPNKRAYVKEDTSGDPDDIDDPRYDKPLEAIIAKKRKCMGEDCDNTFIQDNNYPHRCLCPDCLKKSEDIFSINNIYASEQDFESEKDRVLRAKPL